MVQKKKTQAHWVGYDGESTHAHRIYWQNTNTISVECDIKFVNVFKDINIQPDSEQETPAPPQQPPQEPAPSQTRCNQHHSHLNRAGHNVYRNHPNSCSRLHKVSSQLVIMLKQVVLQTMSMGTLLLHSLRKWKTTPSHFPRLKCAMIGHAGSKPWMQRSPLLIAPAHGATSHSRHIRTLWDQNGFTVSRGSRRHNPEIQGTSRSLWFYSNLWHRLLSHVLSCCKTY